MLTARQLFADAKNFFLFQYNLQFFEGSVADIDLSGQDLTDQTIRMDLAKICSMTSGYKTVNLSNNKISVDTLDFLSSHLLGTKIESLNLSYNAFTENAYTHTDGETDSQAKIPHLLLSENLKRLDLRQCNLLTTTVDQLIEALKKNSTLTTLLIDNVTNEQGEQIQHFLERNKCIDEFRTKYLKDNVLDLQGIRLNHLDVEALSLLIESNENKIKKILTTEFAKPSPASMKPLIDALSKNSYFTTFFTDVCAFSKKDEDTVRLYTMLNQAKRKVMGNEQNLVRQFLRIFLVATVLNMLIPAAPFVLAFITAGAGKFLLNTYFDKNLRKAKKHFAEKTLPNESRAAIELGKKSAHDYLYYFHPKSWTPMAYLGYAVEKHNLAVKNSVENVEDNCFAPIAKAKP